MTCTLHSGHTVTMVLIMRVHPHDDATSVFWRQAGAAAAARSDFERTGTTNTMR